MRLNVSSAKLWSFCLGLIVLNDGFDKSKRLASVKSAKNDFYFTCVRIDAIYLLAVCSATPRTNLSSKVIRFRCFRWSVRSSVLSPLLSSHKWWCMQMFCGVPETVSYRVPCIWHFSIWYQISGYRNLAIHTVAFFQYWCHCTPRAGGFTGN